MPEAGWGISGEVAFPRRRAGSWLSQSLSACADTDRHPGHAVVFESLVRDDHRVAGGGESAEHAGDDPAIQGADHLRMVGRRLTERAMGGEETLAFHVG